MSGPGKALQGGTAQGKQGFWMFIFPDRENTWNLPKNIKNMILHREFNSKMENFEVLKLKDILGLQWDVATVF